MSQQGAQLWHRMHSECLARAEAAERQLQRLKRAWRDVEDVVYSGTVYEDDAPSYYNGPMSDLFEALQAGRAALSDTAQETGDG